MTGLWPHQLAAAEHAHRGQNVIISTGTASGKSLAYLVPSATSILSGATVLYLTPTKALAADQLRSVEALHLDQVRPATFDGDTPMEDRAWVRRHANYVLTNPDMLHRSMLPRHAAWVSFWRRLRIVVVDECHTYRGVFGSHVAQILRRLRRVAAKYGADPVFFLASATASEPGMTGMRLTGLEMAEVTRDASPRGATTIALWEPPLTDLRGEGGAPVRRTATAEAADLLADLVLDGVRTLAFVRSRRAAETVALSARGHLHDTELALGVHARPARAAVATPVLPELRLADKVAAYRAGYLAEDRRLLEKQLRTGELLGVATTNALELGVDVSGLDAVLIAGWPGTRASLWQQAGRAGRDGQDALAVLIARDDPLDTYLVHHPDALFGHPVEATVLDPDNPYVLAPHLCAAASEIPLTDEDHLIFGPAARGVLDELVERGLLRRRTTGWFWTSRDWAVDLADIRGSGGAPVQIVESGTGRLLGTVDEASAHGTVHTGAVHIHRGETYVVDEFDLDAGVALVSAATPDYSTFARDITDIRIIESSRSRAFGPGELHFGSVEVTRQVISYLKRRSQTGELLGDDPLDLPPRTLRTRAVWWTLPTSSLTAMTPTIDPTTDLSGDPSSDPAADPSDELSSDPAADPSGGLSVLTTDPSGIPSSVLTTDPSGIPSSVLTTDPSGVLSSDPAIDLGGDPANDVRIDSANDSANDRRGSRGASRGRGTARSVARGMDPGIDLGGAAHAAEHAAIGLLPLFATCDRWDIGGVSTELHPDTGMLTVFVYDGHDGGAGFAERGYAHATDWLTATRDAIASCECERGCPSCIQSPKCGNGNEPLHKAGALRLLGILLTPQADSPESPHPLPAAGSDSDVALPTADSSPDTPLSDAGVSPDVLLPCALSPADTVSSEETIARAT
ncbi:DEAD/DEAH box helicase [Acrocarpospora phusangensis]|uniref:DEAD/DEAH box helicase n=1 Tax=Acrocarpospora phusangensis TaxID=1070424 RepID=A0A919ULR5_9ACTN|nr:DEAD/DEAH box helicase [Acrocarpospora phusangensis]